ncbi:hypothetical protein AUP68_02322 [Ilyonectria robusta]
MKLRDLRWKLAAHLRLGAQYPDPAAIASKAQQQSNSPLLRLPAEIRNAIIQELLHDAGVSQHIMFQRGRYVRARCVTDHTASDDLMDDCRKFRASRFDDTLMFQRLLSPWGNHWKCEELYKSTRQTQSSPFLSIMLTCSQLYLEVRTFLYHTLTFVIHDLQTLHHVAVASSSPLLSNMKQLQLAIRLPVRREEREKMSDAAHATMARWRTCCSALDQAENLVSVDVWLDTSEPEWRFTLSSVMRGNANPYQFGERLAGILTVNIPVNPNRAEAWKEVANIEPQFAIRARGWPTYRAAPDISPDLIIEIWSAFEPGVPRPPAISVRRWPNRSPFLRPNRSPFWRRY